MIKRLVKVLPTDYEGYLTGVATVLATPSFGAAISTSARPESTEVARRA